MNSTEIFLLAVVIVLGCALIYFVKRLFIDIELRLKDSFKALSFDTLEQSRDSLLKMTKGVIGAHEDLAKGELEAKRREVEALLHPIKQTLEKLDAQGRELEQKRESAYHLLTNQVGTLISAETDLRKQTEVLAKALSSPSIRGTWGQLHLRRVVELCGLLNNCDFYEQKTLDNLKRPDMVIHLPGQKRIVVDSKTPLDAFLASMESKDEKERVEKLQLHAVQIQRHLRELSSKEYWKQFDISPEYVILFLPAESFFSAALQVDPLLIEKGTDQNVLIATPTTLIAILKAVALSWKQESLSQSAKEIAEVGKELYGRIATLSEHWSKLGRSLNQSVEAYNVATASFQTRILSSARKLQTMGASLAEKEVVDPVEIEKRIRNAEVACSIPVSENPYPRVTE